MPEVLWNLDQNIDLPSAGTYKVRFWHRIDYTGSAAGATFNCTFGGTTLKSGALPASGTEEDVEVEHVAGGAGTVQLHLHIGGDAFGLTSLDWRIDNVSVKKQP